MDFFTWCLLLQRLAVVAFPIAAVLLLKKRRMNPIVEPPGPGRGYGVPSNTRFAALPARDQYGLALRDPMGFQYNCGFTPSEFLNLLALVAPFVSRGMQVRARVRDVDAQIEGRPWARKVSAENALFLWLSWLRDYLPIRKLATEYGLCESSVSELLTHYTYSVNEALADEISWPGAAETAALAGVGFPPVFRDVYAVLDATCTEVRPHSNDPRDEYRGDKKFSFINTQVCAFSKLCCVPSALVVCLADRELAGRNCDPLFQWPRRATARFYCVLGVRRRAHDGTRLFLARRRGLPGTAGRSRALSTQCRRG